MKANQNKCHFVSNLSSLDITLELLLRSFSVENSSSKKLLGVTIAIKPNVSNHVKNLQ